MPATDVTALTMKPATASPNPYEKHPFPASPFNEKNPAKLSSEEANTAMAAMYTTTRQVCGVKESSGKQKNFTHSLHTSTYMRQ